MYKYIKEEKKLENFFKTVCDFVTNTKKLIKHTQFNLSYSTLHKDVDKIVNAYI